MRLWGRHAVAAALANPRRRVHCLWASPQAARTLSPPPGLRVELAEAATLARLVPPGAPHQGLVLEAARLEPATLEDLLVAPDPARPLVVLDQVTDPQNLGAVLRSAAAFGAVGLVTQDRHSPPETGALARAAAGALERVPWARVVNLARALDAIAAAGFWRLGLAAEAPATLASALPAGPVALVLGAEGEGLRRNTRTHCDALARIPLTPGAESLNVSVAAGIALYAVAGRTG
ncbi:MAG: 23S rRNA (guanosine(2251)-2'-O)-methyltransferase RlmB [Sphingomonadaceae bacterium]|uniref:23S rRNA (guanosine(2251)-2'-O)-methyltransferase RlmB n=1 Tax=Thermaurantiacus sp. TaxID=2820283 RepID=UPI00298EE534|nr:23S rRNA (guanosine(2251)-2'-O)-methyltransferase RlmB [Thermaurantiacus sp.]MCS6986739.1 23S rRNA (guanosine(2251)-2'-O)-methyltransferase RlmB [Sphingomonadaceae bacterium]MDW8413998.1 23S rRNA (guanosine(2251)-2'-O)-methyltransferase RlmB [Thermaurantiacus sp.]